MELGGRLYRLFLECSGVSTDTRQLKQNSMFFALSGANFNGNEFAEKAIQDGCKYAVVDQEQYATNENIILVGDALIALQGLANCHRNQMNIPVLGITGSNGKTTSKELIGAVLQKKFNCLITKGNLNNHIGVPLTLLEMNEEHEMAVIEMGANKPGDIQELVEIANPTHGIITNVGAAHIEGFGSFEGVIRTKTEMYRFIEETDGELFIHDGDEILKNELPEGVPTFSYGSSGGDVQGELLEQNPFVKFNWSNPDYTSRIIQTKLVGKYNFTNFLAAIAIGTYFEVPNEEISDAIEAYTPSNNRSQVTRTKRNVLVVDCYNANPTSMMAALESFLEMNGEKCCILGDMLELGEISAEEHQKIADYLKENQMNALFVGKEVQKVKSEFPTYSTWKELLADQNLEAWKGKLVLLKGSRGIQLEHLIDHL